MEIPAPVQRLIDARPCPATVEKGWGADCDVWASNGGDFDHPNMNPNALCDYCAETYRRIVRYWSRRKTRPK